jgi:hypothetical protein
MRDDGQHQVNERDVFAMARDASLLLLVFLYIVGFAYRSSYLSALEFGSEFSVDSIFDLLYWAEILILAQLWQFVALLAPLGIVFCFASALQRSRIGKGPHGNMIFTAMIAIALVVTYGGGLLMAKTDGDIQGHAAAGLQHLPGEALEEVRFQRRSATSVEAECASSSYGQSAAPASAPLPVPKRLYYIVDETRDQYEMVSRDPAEQNPQITAMAVRKDDVLCYAVVAATDTPPPRAARPEPATTGAPNNRGRPPQLTADRVALR